MDKDKNNKVQNTFKLWVSLITLLLISAYGYRHWQNNMASKYSLVKTLQYYGYIKNSQRKSLEYLLQESGILKENESIESHFPARGNNEELINDIIKLVNQTQKSFTIRSGIKERWEVKPKEWMKNVDKGKVMEALSTLGFVNAVKPKFAKVDAICILGTTFPAMKERLNYANELLQNKKLKAKHIILLAGERYVSIGLDGSEEELKSISKEYNLGNIKQLTETQLIQKAYKDSGLFNKLEVHVIDTPRGNLQRPNTETAMHELLGWLKKHPEIKTIAFVSSQPNVKYQTAVITEILRQGDAKLKIEIVGSKLEEDEEMHEIIGALGAYIWAKTPYVISKLTTDIKDPKLKERLKKLYSRNPLIYKNLDNLFEKRNKT